MSFHSGSHCLLKVRKGHEREDVIVEVADRMSGWIFDCVGRSNHKKQHKISISSSQYLVLLHETKCSSEIQILFNCNYVCFR